VHHARDSARSDIDGLSFEFGPLLAPRALVAGATPAASMDHRAVRA
jgi:hypothetical protein